MEQRPCRLYLERISSLVIAQCLFLSASAIVLTFAGLVGAILAPRTTIATLPIAAMIIGTALTALIMPALMQRHGRKKTFLLGSLAGSIGAALAASAIYRSSFWGLCIGMTLFGAYQATAQHYRFAAADGLSKKKQAKAVSLVLLGGLAAAFIGPLIAKQTQALHSKAYLGSFVAVSLLATLSFLVVAWPNYVDSARSNKNKKPITLTSNQKLAIGYCAVGYAIMMLIMTTAPLAIVGCGYSSSRAASVIQWHLVAMFAPSLVAGRLAEKWGSNQLAVVGVVMSMLGAVVALMGDHSYMFTVALILSGLGWNAMYVGGTSLLTQNTLGENSSHVQGQCELLTFAFVFVAALMSGWIYEWLGWSQINQMVLLFLFVFLILVLIYKNKNQNS
ncbi:MAG: MFS transporter [Pseudomonadota bacterium]|nr:MFS transporter [Pseudomonadota bacterium]